MLKFQEKLTNEKSTESNLLLESIGNKEVIESEKTDSHFQTKESDDIHTLHVSLQTLIQENSWFSCEQIEKGLNIHNGKMHNILQNTPKETEFKCDKCEYIKNITKIKRIHTVKKHSLVFPLPGVPGLRRTLSCEKCSICGYKKQMDQMNAHIEIEHHDAIEDGVTYLD